MPTEPYPTALTIAGSDSGGGAGIQADLKTFLDHRVFGMSVITSVTAQNTRGVTRVDPVPVDGVRAQLEAVFGDLPIDVVKIGMLGTADHIAAVADFLAALGDRRPPVVLDPVMVASTGHRLLDADAEAVLIEQLLPLATLATPNLDEAAVLAGAEGRDAALTWARSQPCAVLITGGDVTGDTILDVRVHPEWPQRTWTHARIGTRPFHGTGCTLSSAIAARLAHGRELDDAIDGAITYVQALIRAGTALGQLGGGNPPLPHGLD
jgi:hydroxymethylpyrimidine/phosphomethylpyrimidine kinase